MGNSSESATTNKITTARICFGNTRYTTTFRVMPAQPFDVILGSNFIVATEVNYDPVKMTINFAQNQKVDSFSMVPSNCKVTEWAPLILAAGALDCLPAADPDISAILRDVAELFNPTPSISPAEHECEDIPLKRPESLESTSKNCTKQGASLHQLQSDNTIRPIAYASRKLLAAEINYCTSDKEALAVVYGFEKFHHYVHGTCTELHTDHRALISALNNPDPRGRIARWNSALQAYDYTIKHIKGLENGLTDALSRDFKEDDSHKLKITAAQTRSQGPPIRTIRRFGQLDVLADNSTDEEADAEYSTDDSDRNDEIENTVSQTAQHRTANNSYLPSIKSFIKMQKIDSNSKKIIDNLNNNISTNFHSDKQLKHYKLIKNTLYNTTDTENPRLYVPKSLVKSILFHHHDTPMMSHLGHRRTLDKIKQTFYWPKMSRDVFGYIQTCKTCQLTKHSTQQTPGELQPIFVSEPFEMVSIDFAGPFPETESGNKYILVVTDLLTRWVDAVAVPNTTAEITVDILEKRLISLHGSPQKLLSDNGAAFTSHLMNAFCLNYGIKQDSKARNSGTITVRSSVWAQTKVTSQQSQTSQSECPIECHFIRTAAAVETGPDQTNNHIQQQTLKRSNGTAVQQTAQSSAASSW
ncbi:Retrovirus-related Pol polyprotein from transposon [Smittium culicis]|uniref:Retrovirus-related Pol polyprotein from transposon n=1 Tax=Smittium culicis TaxID=133412 RepID=A0A1R1Y6H9_9FUNG|nr:Retrovirus-related Pol polyprotein from transposon [Smittium culicis]